MPSQEHLDATARAVAVIRALRERWSLVQRVDGYDLVAAMHVLDAADRILQERLLEPGHPTPAIPDGIDLDADTIRNAAVTLDRVAEDANPVERTMLEDAGDVLAAVVEDMEGDDGE